jgi:hypothetical protein
MIDGFMGEQSSRKGHTELKTVLKQLVARG